MVIFNLQKSDPPQKIVKFLLHCMPLFSKMQLYTLLRKHRVRINGKIAQNDDIVPSGSCVRVFSEITEGKEKGELYAHIRRSALYKNVFLEHIFFEDDHIIILVKQSHISVQSDKKTSEEKSILGLAKAYRYEEGNDAWLVHRLDRDTSGLLLIAKTKHAAQKFSTLFREKKIKKQYLTVVKGVMKASSGYITKKIKKENNTSIVTQEGDIARTSWSKVATFSNATLLDVQLETGKMHQIRVHFASSGHPIALDRKYGDPIFNTWCRKNTGLSRQFLHAYQLTFSHPFTGKDMFFEAPLPHALENVLKKWS